jgi:hypothetical protein
MSVQSSQEEIMSRALVWLCLVAGSAVPAQPAVAKVIRCDTCMTDPDFRREAEAAGEGTHLVYNLKDNILQQWYVGADTSGEGAKRAMRSSPSRASDSGNASR